MSDLCDLTCEACREDALKVSQEEQLSLIKEIPGWSINTDSCDMLVKKFTLMIMRLLCFYQCRS